VNFLAGVGLDSLLEERQEVSPSRLGWHSPRTAPVPTFNAARSRLYLAR
jgi:hypothetical protein